MIPYPQVLSDLTHLQAPWSDYQEVVNESPLGDEFGIERGYGKWNIRVTWVQHGGYMHERSKELVSAYRWLALKLGKRGNYTDIPLKADGGLFETYDLNAGTPTLASKAINVDGTYTYTLNANRADVAVNRFLAVTYQGLPRLLQVWDKPGGENKIITFPSLPLLAGAVFSPATAMRVRLPDKASIQDTLIVEQGKRGGYPRITRDFTELNGKV